MRRTIMIILLTVTILSVNGCKRDYVEMRGKTEPNFTREELFEYLETHETTLKASDLADIDYNAIEGFITYYSLSTERTVVLGDLRMYFENYMERLENNEHDILISPYLVRELRSERSTRAEYLGFIERFFHEIGIEAEFMRVQRNGIRVYEYRTSGGFVSFNFCQTSNTQRLKLSSGITSTYGYDYTIEIADTSFMHVNSVNFFYSKSGKYMMYIDGVGDVFNSFDEFLNVIRTFTTMDD